MRNTRISKGKLFCCKVWFAKKKKKTDLRTFLRDLNDFYESLT